MKTCCICKEVNSNYKCPTCKEPYCSLVCCKLHKEIGCVIHVQEPVEQPKEKPECNFPTEDTVPIEKLELLRYNDEVKECLKNPHVRDIARAIISDPDPSKLIALAMTEPIFVELADACLKVVEPSNDNESC
ncbi:zinc finger HIT domain-containing protein 3 [Chelonus insularis]|uniref:zinc finger HIT domain-containing protein 3 n=1 Tax=Chelonus insularis TaxID=460826 RepID=UPI00158CE0E6|nr:zinc finger HIT domain-containing protein 3 [Chelonus insularis]